MLASEASQTLSGVTQLRIGDICLFIYVWTWHVILYLDPHVFVFACGLPLPVPEYPSKNNL